MQTTCVAPRGLLLPNMKKLSTQPGRRPWRARAVSEELQEFGRGLMQEFKKDQQEFGRGLMQEFKKDQQEFGKGLMQEFRKELKQELKPLESRLAGLEGRMGGLEGRMGGLEGRMGGLEGRMGGLEGRMGGLEGKMGGLVEDVVRDQISKMFGEGYQRPLLARSLQDLALLLPEETIQLPNQACQSLLAPLAIATKVSRKLVDDKVPESLLASLQDAHSQAWLGTDGVLDEKALGTFIGTSPDRALVHALKLLRRVLVLQSKEEREQELLRCESAGVMCTVAAAFKERYLEGSGSIPSDELVRFFALCLPPCEL